MSAMDAEGCFRLLCARFAEDIVVTAAGNSSELWWTLTGATERVFYLEASMSLTSMFAAGIAMGVPGHNVVVFSGDGAFCMNPGMLLVERQLDLPNLKHFMVSNQTYGSTNDLHLPFGAATDYAGMARAAGLRRVYEFASLETLTAGLDEIMQVPGHCFTILHVEPLRRHVASPPLDGPEVKFRFGRTLEALTGVQIFDAPLHRKP
jgi:sulfopyruvate decarboxylase subunit beta